MHFEQSGLLGLNSGNEGHENLKLQPESHHRVYLHISYNSYTKESIFNGFGMCNGEDVFSVRYAFLQKLKLSFSTLSSLFCVGNISLHYD